MNLFKSKQQIILLCIPAALLIAAVALTSVFLLSEREPPEPSEPGSSEVSQPVASEDSSMSETSSKESASSDNPSSEPEEIKLSVTSPRKADVTVNLPTFTFKGNGDPTAVILLNGIEIKTDENGSFSVEHTLKEGANTFVFSHKGVQTQFTVRYEKIIIKEISPSKGKTADSDDTLVISCTALRDSTVTASFNREKVELYPTSDETLDEYITYVGGLKMPINTSKEKSYGKITFKAVNSSGTATKESGNIRVKTFDPSKYDGGNGYPKGSQYLNVGTSYIAEVIVDQGETYSASDATDLSRPTNNYLPKGTVDYCSPYTQKYTSAGKDIETVTMRFGNKVNKLSSRGNVDVKIYKGELPDVNRLSVASYEDTGRHTMLTLNVDWKAPFRFELGPQSYTSTSEHHRDYTVAALTYDHIDITFCYGEGLSVLPDLTDDPIFSSCELIEGEYDITLRLYLKEIGKFYGWSAEYNDEGQLQFRFLKPIELMTAENEWGYSLNGVKIVVDAGHGGYDNGALGFKKDFTEDVLNLYLAKELEAQLKALGATVIMTRTDDTYITVDDRFSAVRKNHPDLVISIHRNSSTQEYPNGFASYHFNAFTQPIAKSLMEAALECGVYNESAWSKVKWHVFFLSRVTDCPSVLTENGFMSNLSDYANMLDPECNQKCAAAMVKGIMNYFISQQQKEVF